ncbi:4745_t:CDS:1, partial [Scutellospora calospora]
GYADIGRDSNKISNLVPQRYNQGYIYPTSEVSPMPAPYTDVRRQQNNPTRIPSNRIPGSDISRYQPTVNNVSLDRNPTITRQATNNDNNYSQRVYPNNAYTDIPIPPRRPRYANLDRSLSAKNYTDNNRIPPQYSSQSTPMPTIITRN